MTDCFLLLHIFGIVPALVAGFLRQPSPGAKKPPITCQYILLPPLLLPFAMKIAKG
jgi:hypothetical protein